MNKGALDIFTLVIKFLTSYSKLKHVTIGLFEANGITIINFGGQLQTLFEEYKLTNKIIFYVKNESTNMFIMTNLLKQIVSCEKLEILAPFERVCFGHALSIACKYGIFDEKIRLSLQLVAVRIHIVIQHTSLTYHTHIHTQTHNMDESIHKYPCTTTKNVTKKIYYHKTHDANTCSQAKPTPLKESRPMLIRHHSSELH
jgi:hypothetical protein